MNKNQISSLIRAIYNGKINPLKLPKKLYSEIANHLTEGVYKGYGGGLSAFDFDTPDYRMVANLRENVYIFSGAKTFNYVLSTEGLIVEGNEILPFKEFKKRALTVYDQYNDTWLKTEYETAIGQAQNARVWQDIEAVKESFPFVKYQTSNDANVSIICRPLDGVILPVGDPFWATHSPKNHFGCRCNLQSVRDVAEVKPPKGILEPQEGFKMNPGISGEVFDKAHPYFTEIPQKYKSFAKKNFNLNLPEKD
jgi:SPP1 gp7 family putative phage head morphogenesis protein